MKEKAELKPKENESLKLFIRPALITLIFIWFVLTMIFVALSKNSLVAFSGSTLITAVIFINSIFKVEKLKFAVPLRLGKPIGYFLEGLNLGIPFIDKPDKDLVFSLKPDPMDIKFEFISLDNRKIILDSEIRWAPNPKIKEHGSSVPRFAYMTQKMIAEGFNDKIDSEIGRIGGGFYWTIFRDERRGIENYINCILRLGRPAHVNAQGWFNTRKNYEILKEQWLRKDFWNSKETYKEAENFSQNSEEELKTEIPFEKRVYFYSHFSNIIGDILREHGDLGSHSDEEKYYGVNIHDFTLGKVAFDSETQKAMEEEQRTKDRLKASDLVQVKKLERAKEYAKLGVDPQQALNSSEKDVDQGTGNISIIGKGTPVILEGGKK